MPAPNSAAKRSEGARIGRATLAILERGHYDLPDGRRIELHDMMERAIRGTVLYRPTEFDQIRHAPSQSAGTPAFKPPPTRFEVVNETTLAAARRLLLEAQTQPPHPPRRVMALNFASAKNPGGGFLGGAQAQEESLARASGLYACIAPMREMYDANRRTRASLYTDYMIYSPDVPVFRGDDGGLLEEPYPVSFITAPAVNANALLRNEPGNAPRIGPVMRSRTEKVLAVARHQGHDTLVLGAWGCGAFGNDPAAAAEWFREHLTGDGAFTDAFRRIVFAIVDWSPERRFIGPFDRVFSR